MTFEVDLVKSQFSFLTTAVYLNGKVLLLVFTRAYYTWRLYRRRLHASSGQGDASMDPFAKQKVIVDYAKIGLSTVKQVNDSFYIERSFYTVPDCNLKDGFNTVH